MPMVTFAGRDDTVIDDEVLLEEIGVAMLLNGISGISIALVEVALACEELSVEGLIST